LTPERVARLLRIATGAHDEADRLKALETILDGTGWRKPKEMQMRQRDDVWFSWFGPGDVCYGVINEIDKPLRLVVEKEDEIGKPYWAPVSESSLVTR
jgi:hypothetical protein